MSCICLYIFEYIWIYFGFLLCRNLFLSTKQIYQNISKYVQDIQDIYNMPSGGQAAAARPGPEPHGPADIYFGIFVGVVYICFPLEMCTKLNDPRPYTNKNTR